MSMAPEESSREPRCCGCEYWWPYHILPAFGLCKRRQSASYQMVIDAESGPCQDFETRILDVRARARRGDEFFWCGTCRQTLYMEELELHKRHRVYTGVALHDVESNIELTMAGD